MSYIPILKFREFTKILKSLGYFEVRQKGSHVIFENDKGNTITIPNHKGKTLGKGLIRSLINDLNIEVDEFIKILRKK